MGELFPEIFINDNHIGGYTDLLEARVKVVM